MQLYIQYGVKKDNKIVSNELINLNYLVIFDINVSNPNDYNVFCKSNKKFTRDTIFKAKAKYKL